MENAKIKSKKFKEVEVLEGSVELDGTVYPIMNTVRVPADGIKLYGDILTKLIDIENCSRMFFFWLITEMPDSMVVSTDEYQRNRFFGYASKLGVTYKNISIQRAITSLVKNNLMSRVYNTRYMINPELCFKGNSSRLELIKMYRRNEERSLEHEVNNKEEVIKK